MYRRCIILTENADKYFKELQTARDKRMKKLTKAEEREIFRIYNKAFNDAYDDLLKSKQFDSTSATTRAKAVYVQQLYDELNRLQIIVSTDALLQGSYSGFCDTSKIPKKNFDWIRPIEK